MREPVTRAAYAWRCSRATYPDQCGWTGDAQVTRAGPPTRPGQVAWADDPWCPRCGEAAVAWRDGEVVYPESGWDVPSGVQEDERAALVVEVPRAELEAYLALDPLTTSRVELAASRTALQTAIDAAEVAVEALS